MRVVIAGFGDLGQRLARRLVAEGHAVLGLRRSTLAAMPGIETRACDIGQLRPDELGFFKADALVIAVSPDARSEHAYRQTYIDPLPRLAAALGPRLRRSLQVSSTAVYGDADADWIDECTPPQPSRWNGVLQLEAERVGAACLPGQISARASGLYGPGRERLLERARNGESGDGHWTNRIHVEDAASALAHLLRMAEPQDCYCLVDDGPEQEQRVLEGLRQLQGLPPLGTPSLPPSGRRISNARLRQSGWAPRYPTWNEGYRALLRA